MGGRRLRSEEIYDALCDDDAFAQLPGRLAEAFEARSCVIHWHYAGGGAAVLTHSGYFTADQMERYANDFAPLDPWARAAAVLQPPNASMNLEEIVSPGAFERSAFFNEYILPMGDDTFHCMGVRISNTWGAGMIALQRGRSQASFSREAVNLLDERLPHLRRMLSARGRLAAEMRSADHGRSMLDGMGDALLTLDRDGLLVQGNAAAEAMLGAGDFLTTRRGVVRPAVSAHEGEFAAALASAFGEDSKASAVRITDSLGAAAVLTLLPLAGGVDGRRLAMVTVTRGGGRDPTLAERLTALFGLSPGEACVAARLAEGARTEQIAEERAVLLGTVRVQVKSLMAKMGCHRQSEVVAMINRLPRLHRGGG
jgi:DNA-binding CsgD family transcriptional regulator